MGPVFNDAVTVVTRLMSLTGRFKVRESKKSREIPAYDILVKEKNDKRGKHVFTLVYF